MDAGLQPTRRRKAEHRPSPPAAASPAPPAADKVYLIEEARAAPGQLMPIMEDEHGTYIMNSKDLRAVEHVERHADRRGLAQDRRPHQEPLLRGPTAQVYRRAIDDAVVAPSTPECC